MEQSILTAWHDWARTLPPRGVDLIHPLDAAVVARMKPRHIARLDDWTAFQADQHFGAPADGRLHLRLMPQPFIGDLANAKVIILLLNPGLAPVDYHAELAGDEFREELRRNLIDGRSGAQHPFVFLDPKWAWTGGYTWWRSNLSGVIERAARAPAARAAVQKRLAQRLAAVELIPYHSKTSPASTFAWRLKSKDYAVEFARACASQRNVAVIVTRQLDRWIGGELERFPSVITRGKSGRRAWITPDSDAGKVLLESLD